MINFINLFEDKKLEEELALTDSTDVIQYIYNLEPNQQEMFLKRLENIFGETYIQLTRKAVLYLKEQESL